MSLARRRAALLFAAVSLAGFGALAQEAGGGGADPGAPPVGDTALRDPVFRVQGAGLGLERRVEMYQWVPRGADYVRGWSDRPVDAGEAGGGHANPPFPLHSERWLPATITVDGHPLSDEVIARLAGWHEFRPGFSALPGNLSATFQPEGDGLGSAENPLDPQVGDLRIHWLERTLPPLGERIELKDGAWVLRTDAASAAGAGAESRSGMLGWLPVLLGGAGLLVLAVVLARRRR